MSVRVLTAPPSPLPHVPYPGIQEFRFVDQEIFAARDAEIWELVSNVTLYSAVLLYGDSGVGKSSLINAGLLPEVLEENYRPDRLRVQPYARREIKVEKIEAVGGEHPVFLPSNFTPGEADDDSGDTLSGSESFELSLSDFRSQLGQMRSFGDQEGLDPFVAPEGSRPLLIFDQFEEFITLFEEARRGGPDAQATIAQEQALQVQREILKTLVDLVQGKKFPVTVIFSFREDYLAKLSMLFDICPELFSQSQRLVPPTFEELAAIIRAPFDTDTLRKHFLGSQKLKVAGSELSESLAQRISSALERHSEGEPVNLTELQIVCQRLWKSGSPENLFKKGIDNILTDYAEGVLLSLPDELKEGAIGLLSHMVTGSNTRNIISEPDLLHRTTAHVDVSDAQLLHTLDLLRERQLIRRERRRSLHFYELTSEYFVRLITTEVAERAAIEETAKARNERHELAERRAQSIREYRQARRVKRFARVFALLCGVVLILGGVLSYIYQRYLNSERQREVERRTAEARIQAERERNDKYQVVIKAIAGETDELRLEALMQMKQWVKDRDMPPNYAMLLLAAQSTTENVEIKKAALELLAQAIETDPTLAQSIDAVAQKDTALAQKLPPRFYIHIADESQRGLARKLGEALTSKGWVVPGIEGVSGIAPVWDNELRFFRKSDESTPEFAEIKSVLRQATNSNWNSAYVRGYETSQKVGAGTFELWFAAPTGRLAVSFEDAEGNVSKPTLTFQPTVGSGGVQFKSRSSTISVPPGDYEITISAPGHKPITRKLFIRAGEQVNWPMVTLEKEGGI